VIAQALVLLAAGGRPLAELLAAADLGDELAAGAALPDDVRGAIRARADARGGVAPADGLDGASLVCALDAGLRNASTLPLSLGVLAALLSVGGVGALAGPAREAAEDVASGAVQLVADPTGAVPALADGLRAALA
jgi:hypothetical protein